MESVGTVPPVSAGDVLKRGMRKSLSAASPSAKIHNIFYIQATASLDSLRSPASLFGGAQTDIGITQESVGSWPSERDLAVHVLSLGNRINSQAFPLLVRQLRGLMAMMTGTAC